jgi:hypothetical protein
MDFKTGPIPVHGGPNKMASLIKRGLVGALVLVFACLANASLIDDPHGMSGGQGTWQNERRFEPTSKNLCVDVEYAVYAPGQFGLSFSSWIDPNDPDYNTHYVYAYQVFNDVDPHPSPSPLPVTRFSVGINENDEAVEHLSYLIDDPNHKLPTSTLLTASTARWNFVDPNYIPYDYVSVILFFSSPFSPERDNSTVYYNSSNYKTILETDPNPLPSPTPEPVTVGLLGAGLFVLVNRRARRRE